MPLETATYIDGLDASNPVGSTDKVQTLDDHVRLLKSTVKASFPGVTGAVTPTHTELNLLDGVTASTAELNILDGVTADATELNYLDGATGVTGTGNTVRSASPTLTGTVTAATVAATTLTGAGSGITALNATQLTSGTVPDARFPATLPAASGVNLTALNGTNIASGTVADARLSSQVCFKDSEISGADGAGVADPGYRGAPPVSQTGDYTLVLTDAGKAITKPSGASGTWTIPAAASVAFPVGTVILLINHSGNDQTIAITSETLVLAGAGSTGSRTLSGNWGVAQLVKAVSSHWVISGVGLT